jgi:hypothetical protein
MIFSSSVESEYKAKKKVSQAKFVYCELPCAGRSVEAGIE